MGLFLPVGFLVTIKGWWFYVHSYTHARSLFLTELLFVFFSCWFVFSYLFGPLPSLEFKFMNQHEFIQILFGKSTSLKPLRRKSPIKLCRNSLRMWLGYMSELFTTHEVSHELATDHDFIKIPPFHAYFEFTVTKYLFCFPKLCIISNILCLPSL